jgi:myo-inositol 2-dehydrogenase/D-chiro-inositol 1-dehydrogenase
MLKINRRSFIAGSASAAAGFAILEPRTVKGFDANSRIEIGSVGLGGRGSLIARMIAENHKGFQIVSVADYFPEVARSAGNRLEVDPKRQFSGLNGYNKLIDSKVDAVFLETPPCFFPDHAAAAVEAGCHVYMAKPVACDVPGTLAIARAGKRATRSELVFLVDFQVPTDPFNIETAKRIHEGMIGEVGMISSIYTDESFADPPKTENAESRLRSLIWVNDIDLGGSYLVNAGIHAIDAGLWLAKAPPISAMGASRVVRANPNGDSRDAYSITFTFADGLIMNHRGEHIRNTHGFVCNTRAYGQHGYAEVSYTEEAWLRGNKGGYKGGEVKNLYASGISRNLDKFEKNIRSAVYENETARSGADSTLATILGREAAIKRTHVTMKQLIAENKRIEPDLSGLKT